MSIRLFIVYFSLIMLGAVILAFWLGPEWGLRLDYEKGQHLQIIEIVAPVFVAYLSSAVTYALYGSVSRADWSKKTNFTGDYLWYLRYICSRHDRSNVEILLIRKR
jgi:hypothetical protein